VASTPRRCSNCFVAPVAADSYVRSARPEHSPGETFRGVQRASFGRRTITLVDYSQIDADLAPGEKSVGTVTTLDYLDGWTGLTDTEFHREKAPVTAVLRRRLEAEDPQLSDAVEHAELATPRVRWYTLDPGGTAYGFAQTPSQSLFDRRIESPVSNLAVASAWTFPGEGFTGAVVSGYLAAGSVLQRAGPSRRRPRGNCCACRDWPVASGSPPVLPNCSAW
jgi:phytoene dehydrogenase-like protein